MFNHLLNPQYREVFDKINLDCMQSFTTVKQHVLLKCRECGNEFSATPISKYQNFNKHGRGGCPICTMKARHAEGKAAVLTGLLERGITPVSDYDGGYGTSAGNKVKWYNSNCGHTFESSPGNVIVKKLDCSICGAARRADINRERGVERFVEWSKTAPAWKIYRAMVTRYTTQAYKKHKELLNPNDHPIGIAGTDGAYQVDHIVSVRKCFDHRVPPALCYDASNLRVIPWLANSNKSEKFDRSIPVPTIFNEHVKDYQFVTPVNPYTHDEMLAMTNSVATQFLVEDDSDADAFFEHLDDDETDE